MRNHSFTGRLAGVLAVAAVGSAVVAAPVASAAPAWECSANYICFYVGSDGTGKRCQYSQSNAQADEECSWGLVKPRSVRNRSDNRVHYYAQHDFEDRIGSTVAGDQGNLAGTYTIRSLKFG